MNDYLRMLIWYFSDWWRS